MRSGEGGVPEQLLARAARAAAPQLTDAVMARRFGSRQEWTPTPGQIWRVTYDDVGMLVLIVAVDVESVTVTPATVEPTGEDADSLIVEDTRTALGHPVTLWAGLQRSLPTMVLDRPVDDIGSDVVRWVTVRGDLPERCRAGTTPASPLDPDTDVRAAVEDDLTMLAATPSWAQAAHTEAAATIPVPAPSDLEQLAQRLSVTLPMVLDLVDGKRAPTPDEAAAMREVLGAAPTTAAPPPAGLVVELNQPRWRGIVRQWARQRRTTENEARATAAYEVSAAMAARQTGDQEPSWPDRIASWAAAHGLDEEDSGT